MRKYRITNNQVVVIHKYVMAKDENEAVAKAKWPYRSIKSDENEIQEIKEVSDLEFYGIGRKNHEASVRVVQ